MPELWPLRRVRPCAEPVPSVALRVAVLERPAPLPGSEHNHSPVPRHMADDRRQLLRVVRGERQRNLALELRKFLEDPLRVAGVWSVLMGVGIIICALILVSGARSAVAPPDPPGGIQPVYCNSTHYGWRVIASDGRTMQCVYHRHPENWVVYYPSWGYIDSCPPQNSYVCYHWDDL